MNGENSLTIVAVGDIALNGRYHRILKERGIEHPLRAVSPHWVDADLRVGNLECVLTKEPRVFSTRATLRGADLSADVLNYAKIDCVSLANNHMTDFGPKGITDTRAVLDAVGVKHTGAGANENESTQPVLIESKGQSVGILSFCSVEDRGLSYAGKSSPGVANARSSTCFHAIAQLRKRVDWLVVNLHWGMEMSQLPSPSQRQFARRIVDMGADVVLGHHAHVLQPIESIDGTPIVYSLGNFLFSDMYWRGRKSAERFVDKLRLHPLSRQTGWVRITLNKSKTTEWEFIPACLTRQLAIEVDTRSTRYDDFRSLGMRLQATDYTAEFANEEARAERRTWWRRGRRTVPRWIELKLYSYGLIPHAGQAT